MSFLFHNLLHFGRLLRSLGLDVQAARTLDVAQAIAHLNLDVGRRSDFYHTLRCLLVHRSQDLALFDEAFRTFWRRPPGERTTQDLRALGEQRRFGPPQVEQSAAEPPDSTTHGGAAVTEIERVAPLSYSAREVLRTKNFERFTEEEIAQARRMMAELRWELGVKRTRRWIAARGPRLDLRRAIRSNLRYGAELVALPTRQRKTSPRPLIVLCDVSGSMERYSRMLLHFISCVADRTHRVESFLFATRLTRITRHLHRASPDEILRAVPRHVPDFAGGTRIGDALKAFHMQWARRVLGRGPVVLLISDGWDRGDPVRLAHEMARLQRSCHRLIWLNPLLGSTEYRPLTRGMQAALPYVDDFLPVHNLESLEALAEHLNMLPVHRPGRSGTGAAPVPL